MEKMADELRKQAKGEEKLGGLEAHIETVVGPDCRVGVLIGKRE